MTDNCLSVTVATVLNRRLKSNFQAAVSLAASEVELQLTSSHFPACRAAPLKLRGFYNHMQPTTTATHNNRSCDIILISNHPSSPDLQPSDVSSEKQINIRRQLHRPSTRQISADTDIRPINRCLRYLRGSSSRLAQQNKCFIFPLNVI